MAAVGRSVQFRGINNVLTAYESNQIAPWALFQGTQLLAKSELNDLEANKALLSELLNRLNNEDNIATYTLCVYDDLKESEKIKSNMPFDGSFNFKLNDSMENYKTEKHNAIGAIMQKIEALETRLMEKEKDDDEPEDKTPWGAIGKLIDHPDVQKAIAGKFVAILDGITNLFPGGGKAFLSPSYPAQIGAVTASLSADQTVKVNQAIEYLSLVDPLLGDHLFKIALVAKTDIEKYNQIVAMTKLL